MGDVCDGDADGDDVPNDEDCAPLNADVYTGAPCDDGNPETMNDAIQDDCSCIGIAIEIDTDGDGIPDSIDNCPTIVNPSQGDIDMDGVGNLCDDDIDGDSVLNEDDCAPRNAALYFGAPCDDGNFSTINDMIQEDCTCMGTILDLDSDQDGIPNSQDNCPHSQPKSRRLGHGWNRGCL